jgi:ribosome-binding protein aMBF1 (putative translation factor)
MDKKRISASGILANKFYRGQSKERIAKRDATINDLMLGDKIRELREKHGLTQAKLAEMIGSQASNISRIEDADYEGHSVETLRRIAAALHTKLKIEFVAEELQTS